ncbi:hypothetical protein CDL15_Pgr026565 [Punica granatum]|uniref:Ubiquitin-like protease family profile domain-containing protein n=1 Tax=Punica granatum TaxID=22663 RepID=A0A218WLG3_PUNGR|nr:hypothetical protein CDL15_Pgr026565 [Punica granatum]
MYCDGHPKLSVPLGGERNYKFEFPETIPQSNGVDWGMYIIKYMEALDENLWRCTYYKNPEMGVERLRLLASLLKSPYNDFRDVLWYTDPNSRLFDEMVLFSDEEDVAKD